MPQPDRTLSPIEVYLAKVGKELNRRMPKELAKQRVAEAREHLTERAEEFVAQGMAQGQAESTAVSAFGPAREWAHSVMKAAYSDAGAVLARRIAAIAAIAAILCGAGAPIAIYGFGEGSAASNLMKVFGLFLVCLAILSFRSRSSRTPLLLAVATMTIVTVGIYVGCSFYRSGEVLWSRYFVNEELRSLSLERGYYQRESQMLRLGIATYVGSEGQTAHFAVPSALRTHVGRFIVPRTLVIRSNAIFFDPYPNDPALTAFKPIHSAFKEFPDEQRVGFHSKDHLSTPEAAIQMMDRAPYRTVATEEEAAQEWRRFGPAWLTSVNVSIRNVWEAQANWKRIVANSGLNVDAAWRMALNFSILMALVVLVDFVAAAAGRWAFRFTHRNRGMASV